MKLSKRLMNSGVLGSGRVRHYSEWDFDSLETRPRFGAVSPALQLAERRRLKAKVKRRTLLTFPARVIGRLRKR